MGQYVEWSIQTFDHAPLRKKFHYGTVHGMGYPNFRPRPFKEIRGWMAYPFMHRYTFLNWV